MNKRTFVGATVITATVVGGLVYYRHQIRDKAEEILDKLEGRLLLDDPSEDGLLDDEEVGHG